MPSKPDPAVLLAMADNHLGMIANYNPYRNFTGIKTRKAFSALIEKDPAFPAFGFGDERYAIARIGGNLITSLHRKVGDLYEDMFAYLLQCRFGLKPEALAFSVEVPIGSRVQLRSIDGFIRRAALGGVVLPMLPPGWEKMEGMGFEVRSCYQIGDSKRIQADWDIALALTVVAQSDDSFRQPAWMGQVNRLKSCPNEAERLGRVVLDPQCRRVLACGPAAHADRAAVSARHPFTDASPQE